MADKQNRSGESWIETRGYRPISSGSGRIIKPPAGATAADVPASPDNQDTKPTEGSPGNKQ